jgi:hypothetical protein
MCSGCSGGYQDDYEDPQGDDLDQESPLGKAGATLDNPTDNPTDELTDGPTGAPANGRERIDGEHGERFRGSGTREARQRRIVRPFEDGYEVLVGVDRILEIRIVRAKCVESGGLPTEDSRGRRQIANEKGHKHYQTYAIGYPPYQQPGGAYQALVATLVGTLPGLLIRFWFWGLAAFSVGTLAAWIFLR